MSLSYREECNRRKNVRQGVDELQPVNQSKTVKVKDWLIVCIDHRRSKPDRMKITILGEFTSEDIAKRALHKGSWYRYMGSYYCHRSVYMKVKALL